LELKTISVLKIFYASSQYQIKIIIHIFVKYVHNNLPIKSFSNRQNLYTSPVQYPQIHWFLIPALPSIHHIYHSGTGHEHPKYEIIISSEIRTIIGNKMEYIRD
jgi:hypothetical protein